MLGLKLNGESCSSGELQKFCQVGIGIVGHVRSIFLWYEITTFFMSSWEPRNNCKRHNMWRPYSHYFLCSMQFILSSTLLKSTDIYKVSRIPVISKQSNSTAMIFAHVSPHHVYQIAKLPASSKISPKIVSPPRGSICIYNVLRDPKRQE